MSDSMFLRYSINGDTLVCFYHVIHLPQKVLNGILGYRKVSGVESENFQFRIRDECTVFVAELLCLNFAVKWITEQNSVISEYLICTDSLSSLDSLKCISSSNNIIVEIQKQLKSLRDKNISIDFAFVRGHTGVLGNERADWLAKAATKRKIDIDVNIPKSFYKKITNERMMKSWNQEYLISNKIDHLGVDHRISDYPQHLDPQIY
ncbi:RNase H domain-containing protein [Trichonephila clavipes]|nr:RNase H domain-containing protein [Trichonephila clavipes]